MLWRPQFVLTTCVLLAALCSTPVIGDSDGGGGGWSSTPPPTLIPDQHGTGYYQCGQTYGPIEGELSDYDTYQYTQYRDVEWDWDWVHDAGEIEGTGEEDYLHGWQSFVNWIAPSEDFGELIGVYAIASNWNTSMASDGAQGYVPGVGYIWSAAYLHDPNCPYH